ncbi:hypothetical protein FQA39_LY00015 [Lamprigera yunnana]|nr:hypothetical protein FQA39_LY00015 [Lamprigera yunnana]
MVRRYNRKSERQQWTEERMQEAVQEVVNSSMVYKKAAGQFNVRQTTLKRRVKKIQNNPEYRVKKTLGKYRCVFSDKQEAELVDYLTKLEAQLFGVTMNEFRELLLWPITLSLIIHLRMGKQNWSGQEVSWIGTPIYESRKQHQQLKPWGLIRSQSNNFLELLSKVVYTHQLTGDMIFNCDETELYYNADLSVDYANDQHPPTSQTIIQSNRNVDLSVDCANEYSISQTIIQNNSTPTTDCKYRLSRVIGAPFLFFTNIRIV